VQWQHRSYGHPADPEYPWGATLYGSKGTLRLSVHKWEFKPIKKREKTISQEAVYELEQYPEDKIEKDLERHVAPAVRGHMKNFLHCVDTRERPVSDIEEGHISATSCILANVAMKLGRTLHWDPDTNRVLNDDEANQLLTRDYRKPWIHPDPSKV
ncbi:gfo/Idh/MocA family oxidoreductase, partial [bacterium]|nr:gfo/Idh/MocA family oxidoreductase [bacterium]